MKRPNYKITLNGKYLATKHAWNSALRLIQQHVQQEANQDDCTFTLASQSHDKDSYGKFCKGHRLWTNDRGDKLHYEIELLPD